MTPPEPAEPSLTPDDDLLASWEILLNGESYGEVQVYRNGSMDMNGMAASNKSFTQAVWEAMGSSNDGLTTSAALYRFFQHTLPESSRGAYRGQLVQMRPSGTLTRYRANALPAQLTPNAVLAETLAGRLTWAFTNEGGGLKAGGKDTDGRELWLTLSEQPGRKFLFVVTEGLQVRSIKRQRDFLIWRCALSKLNAAIVPENVLG